MKYHPFRLCFSHEVKCCWMDTHPHDTWSLQIKSKLFPNLYSFYQFLLQSNHAPHSVRLSGWFSALLFQWYSERVLCFIYYKISLGNLQRIFYLKINSTKISYSLQMTMEETIHQWQSRLLKNLVSDWPERRFPLCLSIFLRNFTYLHYCANSVKSKK